MKSAFTWAAVLCLTAAGCAGNGIFAQRGCNNCSMQTMRSAPRPQLRPGASLCSCSGILAGGADCCGDGGCDAGGPCSQVFGSGQSLGGRVGQMCDGYCCVADGCDDRCRRIVGNIAGGMCGSCSDGCGLCPHSGGYPEPQNFNPGPPTGQVAYPYYTTRGPRDFLQNNPTRIGPY